MKIFYNEPGKDYLTGVDKDIDGELVEQLSTIEGIANVSLTARRGGGDHLRLVA